MFSGESPEFKRQRQEARVPAKYGKVPVTWFSCGDKADRLNILQKPLRFWVRLIPRLILLLLWMVMVMEGWDLWTSLTSAEPRREVEILDYIYPGMTFATVNMDTTSSGFKLPKDCAICPKLCSPLSIKDRLFVRINVGFNGQKPIRFIYFYSNMVSILIFMCRQY
ncbi:hypothetical protein Hanom_Chr05g00396851 [Helianthus anomalus]